MLVRSLYPTLASYGVQEHPGLTSGGLNGSFDDATARVCTYWRVFYDMLASSTCGVQLSHISISF